MIQLHKIVVIGVLTLKKICTHIHLPMQSKTAAYGLKLKLLRHKYMMEFLYFLSLNKDGVKNVVNFLHSQNYSDKNSVNQRC